MNSFEKLKKISEGLTFVFLKFQKEKRKIIVQEKMYLKK